MDDIIYMQRTLTIAACTIIVVCTILLGAAMFRNARRKP